MKLKNVQEIFVAFVTQ